MRNADQWRPTKFVRTRAGLRASRNPKNVAIESRLIADLVAANYESMVQAHSSGKLLDLGCGNAPLYETYRELIDSNTCADWSNSLHKNTYLDVVLDLGEKLPFRDEAFDTVLLTDVLEHIAEPRQLMYETARVLRVRGKLILGVPFLYWLHEEPYDYYRFTRFALQRLSAESGLRVLDLYAYGGLPEALVDITCKGLGIFTGKSQWLVRAVQAFGSAACRFSLVRKVSRMTAEQLPLGYILVAQKTSD